MKRIILFLAVIAAMVCNASAQSQDLQKWAYKTGKKGNLVGQSDKVSTPPQTNEYNKLMEKSTKFQCGALTCASIGTGLSIAGAIIGTKGADDYKGDMDKIESDRKLRKSLFIGAGVSFAAALCFELVAIDYKLKAGKSLKVFSNGTGGGLAFTF